MCAAKREAWEVEETQFLLPLIREKQILKALNGKRFRAADIFQHLEEPMHERGYHKNGKQMQTRFKTLRSKAISQLEGVDSAQSSKESNSESNPADYQDADVTLTNDDLQHDTTDRALEDHNDVQDSEEPTPKRRLQEVVKKQIESKAELFEQQREFEVNLMKNFMEQQKEILQQTTNSLISCLNNVF
ncbi:hypothetical protein RN001_006409 [Aquatica leii]|uniref:Myb/SANT-like DNA-binding domain-containing protein n=1 Tax=Aquatica leii TaxID=1421715 RepID=A0AAN7P7Z2_9COLE|nr:hypothetical protein RN001_006409 [Aquatica leii]